MKRFLGFVGGVHRIGMVLLLSGCAASMSAAAPIQQRLETEMISPEFSRENLRSGGLVILAVLTAGAPEGVQQNAAYEIFQGLRSSFPEVRVISRLDAIEKITSADRVAEYRAFVKKYEERRSMNLDQLKQWAQIEGTRYLFIGEVGYAAKRTEAWITQIGEKSVAGRVSVFSSGPSMIPEEVTKRILLRGEIWDSLCGRAVWIGSSASEVVEVSGSEKVRVEDIFIATGRGLSASIEKAMTEKQDGTLHAQGSKKECS